MAKSGGGGGRTAAGEGLGKDRAQKAMKKDGGPVTVNPDAAPNNKPKPAHRPAPGIPVPRKK